MTMRSVLSFWLLLLLLCTALDVLPTEQTSACFWFPNMASDLVHPNASARRLVPMLQKPVHCRMTRQTSDGTVLYCVPLDRLADPRVTSSARVQTAMHTPPKGQGIDPEATVRAPPLRRADDNSSEGRRGCIKTVFSN